MGPIPLMRRLHGAYSSTPWNLPCRQRLNPACGVTSADSARHEMTRPHDMFQIIHHRVAPACPAGIPSVLLALVVFVSLFAGCRRPARCAARHRGPPPRRPRRQKLGSTNIPPKFLIWCGSG